MKKIDEAKLLNELHNRYLYVRDSGHLEYQKKARKCEEFFRGEQWDSATKKKLQDQRRPALTLNKTLSSMMVLFSEQLRNRAAINFVPATSDATPEVATVLNKLWLYTANSNRLRWVESQVFDDGVITGRGFFDIRMDFSRNVFGEIKISHINPMNVMIDPDAEEYDPDHWSDVFYSKWLSIEDIKRIYGKTKAEEVRRVSYNQLPLGYDFYDERPDTFGGYELARQAAYSYVDSMNDYRRRVRVIERQWKQVEMQPHFIDLETGDMSMIPEGMPREKIQAICCEFNVEVIERPVDVYYWTVSAAGVLLHHAEMPYKHFTIVPFFPIFRRGGTIGMVENLIDPQELYNKARSQELHVINTSANSGWKGKISSIRNMTVEELEERGAETGLVLDLDNPDDVQKITPNPIPTGLDRVSYIAGEDLKEISMASDSMRGFDREDVAAKAIQAKQKVGGKNFAKIMDNLAHTRTLLASRALDLMQTFYTTERQFLITGEGIKAETETIMINKPDEEGSVVNDITLGKYDVVVSTVPDRETMQQTNLEQAIQLRELGVPIPDKVLIENSTLENKEELLETEPDPLTQQKVSIELEQAQAEVEKIRAEVAKLKADAALSLVRAGRDVTDAQMKEREAAQPQQAPSPATAVDPAKLRELALKERELALKEQELKVKQALQAQELELKRVSEKAKTLVELKKLQKAG